ncbi:nuclear transport factor 2 family protein [Paractinoplanes globisporus]|uniref:Nuclear transport factor 2 family protein n=1 Tax=Paractinoplanes globisporus TaxID=113565 RepID=A0ABW6WCF2_9ACTN|nr:nuclear transport factor 2 family protein [Actinoplanes globisporus]
MTGLPGTDLAAYLRRYPWEVTFGEEDPAVVFDRYHAPGFVLHNDGTPLDRERLIAHVASGRKRAAEVRVAVRDVATTGDVVAARYVLTAVMRKGEVIDTEIFMFGRLAPDGRLREVTQLTRR